MKLNQTSISLKCFYLLIFFGFGSLFPLLGVYLKQEVGLNGTEVGSLMSISPVVMIAAQPFWGMVTDLTRRPKLILAGTLFLASVIGFTIHYVKAYYELAAILTLFAFVQSAIVPVSDSILLTYVHRSGKEYGNYRLFGSIGFSAAVYAAGKLSERFSVAVIFTIFASLMLISLFFVKGMPKEGQTLQTEFRKGLSRLIKMPAYMMFLLATFLIFGPILANNYYFGFYIQQIGGTLAGVGIAFLLAAGSEAPFMKFSGKIIKRWGMMPIMMFAGAVSALRWTFYYLHPSLHIILATAIVQGFSVGLFIPAAMNFVKENTPADVRATAVALYTAVGNGLGSWFCTFIGGILFDSYSIFVTYLFFGAMTFAGLFMVFLLSKKQRKEAISIHSMSS